MSKGTIVVYVRMKSFWRIWNPETLGTPIQYPNCGFKLGDVDFNIDFYLGLIILT